MKVLLLAPGELREQVDRAMARWHGHGFGVQLLRPGETAPPMEEVDGVVLPDGWQGSAFCRGVVRGGFHLTPVPKFYQADGPMDAVPVPMLRAILQARDEEDSCVAVDEIDDPFDFLRRVYEDSGVLLSPEWPDNHTEPLPHKEDSEVLVQTDAGTAEAVFDAFARENGDEVVPGDGIGQPTRNVLSFTDPTYGENTDTSGGTRFSAGKPVRCWAPFGGLDLVWAYGRTRDAADLRLHPRDRLLVFMEAWFRRALRDPLADDGGGALMVTKAVYAGLLLGHAVRAGCGATEVPAVPYLGLDGPADRSVFGAEKYAALDWDCGQWFSTLLSSGHRHAAACLALGPESVDPDGGQPHLWGFLWNGLCLLDFIAQDRLDLDDVSPWRGINTAMRRAAERVAQDRDVEVLAVLRDFRAGKVELVA